MPSKPHTAALTGLLILAGLLTGTSSGSGPAAEPARRAAKPNIVLILTDDQDLLLDSLDAMPQTWRQIAKRGAVFSQQYVPLSLCCPSRATILTGQYAHNHGVYLNSAPGGGFVRFRALGREETSLAVTLDRAGYRTALFGKYLNDYPTGSDETHIPTGWDEWIVPIDGSAYAGFNYRLNHNGTLIPRGEAPDDYLTDVLAEEARDFVARAAAGKDPFFLYLAPYAPHKPSTPAPRHARAFGDSQVPRTPSYNEADVSDKPKARQRPPLTRHEMGNLDVLYRKRLRTLRAVDEMVAGLLDGLRQAGQMENTYVFFTSDNGFHMGQHRLLASKYTPFEEDIRVPLLVRGPGVPAGLKVDAFTMSIDLAPTIADLAGATLQMPSDGRSLVPLLRGRKPGAWRQAVLIEQLGFREEPQDESGVLEPSDVPAGQQHSTLTGLRTRTYKYVEYDTGEREYYDLIKDPYELSNLAAALDPAYAARLSRYMAALRRCAGAGCRAAETAPVPGP